MIHKIYIICEWQDVITISCKNKFKKAQLYIEAMGFEVANPIEIIENYSFEKDKLLRLNLNNLVVSDAVYIMPCVSFVGVKNIELLIALKLDIFIFQ